MSEGTPYESGHIAAILYKKMLSYIPVIHAIIVFEKINEMSVIISENARSYDRGEKELFLHIILFIDYKQSFWVPSTQTVLGMSSQKPTGLSG